MVLATWPGLIIGSWELVHYPCGDVLSGRPAAPLSWW